jgi:hypothetical protein
MGDLARQKLGILASDKGEDAVTLGMPADHIKGADANRAGRTENGERFQSLIVHFPEVQVQRTRRIKKLACFEEPV